MKTLDKTKSYDINNEWDRGVVWFNDYTNQWRLELYAHESWGISGTTYTQALTDIRDLRNYKVTERKV